MEQQQTFVIRRAFVVPMGLLIVLTVALLVVCLLQGQPLAKVVILAGLIIPIAATASPWKISRTKSKSPWPAGRS
ncbi:MAG: hypothetical protein P8X54_06000, partial [Desulfuromonadales bacterium]